MSALAIGLVDTLGRAYLPAALRLAMSEPMADGVGASLSSMSVYILMALVLAVRPRGLFPAAGT